MNLCEIIENALCFGRKTFFKNQFDLRRGIDDPSCGMDSVEADRDSQNGPGLKHDFIRMQRTVCNLGNKLIQRKFRIRAYHYSSKWGT